MKIQYMSDLHLEFAPDFRPANVGSDVLVLAGDICVWEKFRKTDASASKRAFVDFLSHCSQNWKDVIYVPGNHEYYQGDYHKVLNAAEAVLYDMPNIHLLDNCGVVIDDITFVGTTLWTSMNNGNPITKGTIKDAMNDYRTISYLQRKLSPDDTMLFHQRAVNFIETAIADELKVVVVTHMAPTELSVHPRFKNDRDYHINYAYYSDLSNLILDNPHIKAWFHGHMHDSFEYEMGETTVLVNPKGYGNQNPNFDPNKIWEIV